MTNGLLQPIDRERIMGASGWSYFVPFQSDIGIALQELRGSVFHSGDYYQPAKWLRQLLDRGTIDQQKFQQLLARAGGNDEPKTMQDLIEMRGAEGTHSIIDITSVSTEGGQFTVTPLTPEEYTRLLGMNRPTHQIVEEKATQLMTLRGPWQGIYVLVYRDGQPDEIFFTGLSGD